MDDHADDVASSRGCAGAEDYTDGNTVDDTGDDSVEEEVGDEVFLDVTIHIGKEAGKGFLAPINTVMDERSISVVSFEEVGEYGNKYN